MISAWSVSGMLVKVNWGELNLPVTAIVTRMPGYCFDDFTFSWASPGLPPVKIRLPSSIVNDFPRYLNDPRLVSISPEITKGLFPVFLTFILPLISVFSPASSQWNQELPGMAASISMDILLIIPGSCLTSGAGVFDFAPFSTTSISFNWLFLEEDRYMSDFNMVIFPVSRLSPADPFNFNWQSARAEKNPAEAKGKFLQARFKPMFRILRFSAVIFPVKSRYSSPFLQSK